MKEQIINQFTNCSWFRRGILVVDSWYSTLVNGRYEMVPLGTKTYRRRFFIRQATDEELQNAGLSEITSGVLMLHTEFDVPFSDGRPVDFEKDGEIISGVTLSSVITWHGYKYRILKFGDWSDWKHRYYFLDKMSKEGVHA